MKNDPIVNEIRRIRRAYAQQFDNDLHAICEDLRRQEHTSTHNIRTPQPAPDPILPSARENPPRRRTS